MAAIRDCFDVPESPHAQPGARPQTDKLVVIEDMPDVDAHLTAEKRAGEWHGPFRMSSDELTHAEESFLSHVGKLTQEQRDAICQKIEE